MKKPAAIAIAVLLTAAGIFLVWQVVKFSGMFAGNQPEETPAPVIAETPEPTPEPTPELTPEPTPEIVKDYMLSEEKLKELKEELVRDQGINSDVRCILHFNNDLVHDPVLQYENENYYLYLNWQTREYQSYGSIVLDSRNNLALDEMNTIIYGHYIYEFRNPDRTLVFTPLARLMDKSVWEENRYVTLLLNDEVRYYEICSVYDCPLQTMADGSQFCLDGLEYNLLYFDSDYFARYKENIRAHEYYSTGVDFYDTDRFLTLQTCIENHHESREIVLCRELERKPLS